MRRSTKQTRRARLRQKNAYNFVTALLFLLSRWMSVFAALVLWTAALANYDRFGVFALFAATVAIAAALHRVLRRCSSARACASSGSSRRSPRSTIRTSGSTSGTGSFRIRRSRGLFSGTPFRGMMLRAMGMKVGGKVFDCSRSITERTLTEVGDYANLNEGCVLQAHSLEEGVFKSDYIRIGNGCSIGPGAFVHYGVSMGDHVVLDADSFLMKGESARLAYRLARQSGEAGAPLRG